MFLGSRWCFDKKTGFYHSRQKLSDKGSPKKTCLVIPEGIESEINLLLKFSLHCARQFPKIQFVWRLHPLFTFDALASKNKFYRSVPDNVELSDRELDQDLERCNSVLYRGSSAVIQAVIAGLSPIYLHVPGQMKIDPLYELDELEMEIETAQDFNNMLKRSIYDYTNYQKAREYCMKIYVPFNYQILKNIMKQ
jgi:hypothetical protein